MTDCFHFSLNLTLINLAMISAPPPGGNGTTILTGLLGKSVSVDADAETCQT
jgi:hypothetical protein